MEQCGDTAEGSCVQAEQRPWGEVTLPTLCRTSSLQTVSQWTTRPGGPLCLGGPRTLPGPRLSAAGRSQGGEGGEGGAGGRDAHVQGLLGLGGFVLGAVADHGVALRQVQVERDEGPVLQAQRPQGGAVDLSEGEEGRSR